MGWLGELVEHEMPTTAQGLHDYTIYMACSLRFRPEKVPQAIQKSDTSHRSNAIFKLYNYNSIQYSTTFW